jgi:tRNA nucleotidyltransferase/poly(A) polymerase
MSDYMFMLESHLSPEQNRAVAAVEAAAGTAGMSLFLTGGAMRDMVGGFPIRDLDFTVEGEALKLAKLVAKTNPDVRVVSTDNLRHSAEMLFPGRTTVSISMAHQARYAKAGAKPQVEPATIHEDLRGRDFTINAIALSLSRASRGLLLDPTNGQGDLERREIRTASNYALYDEPGRIFRLLRLKVRLGFAIEERTQTQYQNVREAKLENKVPPSTLLIELRHIADEPNPGELLEVLAQENLLHLISPALTGEKMNLAGFAKLQKAHALAPFGVGLTVDNLALFLFTLTEKLSPRERAEMVNRLGLAKEEVQSYQKLEPRNKKLEQTLKSARLNRASLVYQTLRETPGEQVLLLSMRSGIRLVTDRVKNHLQKYLVTAHEVSDKDPALAGLEPGTAKFRKAKEELIAAHLDGRIRKPAPEEIPAPVPVSTGPRHGAAR